MSYSISDQERTILTDYQVNGSPAEQRRARIILLSASDLQLDAIAEATGLSMSTIRQWRREWIKKRLAIFPDYIESGSVPVDNEADEAPAGAGDQADRDDELAPPASDRLDGDEPGEDKLSEDDAQLEATALPSPIYEPRLIFDARDSMDMQPDDPMAEAGRKAILFHFERMIMHEPGSRLGEDIEEVHDMRVATRRMRSAIRLFEPFFRTKALKPFNYELRRMARALGDVRDLDVFIEKAQAFAEAHPEHDLTPLLRAWNKQRKKARRALIKELNSKGFAQFVKRFYKFLSKPGKGAKALPAKDEPVAYQVRHIAPRLIYEHYEQIRAYEPVLDGAPITILHALRIDFKRFRYALEFFEEVLGPEARDVIEEVKLMQDHLGDLNDAQVARDSLLAFINDLEQRYKGKSKRKHPDTSGVLAYVQAKNDEQHLLQDTFPVVWDNFMREDVRRNLALAVSAL